MYNIKDRQMILLSLSIFFIGLIFVFIASSFKPGVVSISSIDYSFAGKYVSICGYTDSISSSPDGHVFAVFYDSGNQDSRISVVFFKDTAKAYDVMSYLENQGICCVSGSVDIYNGNLEIVADNIWFPDK